jgi:hypothetical protein
MHQSKPTMCFVWVIFIINIHQIFQLEILEGPNLAPIETCHVSIVFINEQQGKGNMFVMNNQQNQD